MASKDVCLQDLRDSAATLPPEFQGRVLACIKEIETSKSTSLSILLTGKTGCGKSTLTNGILGVKIEPPKNEGSKLERSTQVTGANEGSKLGHCTTQVTPYVVKKNGIEVTLWDTPGLQDGTKNQPYYIQQIKEKCQSIDLILYCINMTEIRFVPGPDNPHVVAMQKFTDAFSQDFWKKTIIVLTYANSVDATNMQLDDLSPEERISKFKEQQKEFEDAIQVVLTKDIKLPTHVVNAIRIVPAGHYKRPSLPGYQYWLSNMWFECIAAIPSPAARFALAMISQGRMKKENDVQEADFKKEGEEQPIVVTESNIKSMVAIGGASGIVAGGGTGAAIGAVVAGPFGAAVGVTIGAIIGAIMGGGTGGHYST